MQRVRDVVDCQASVTDAETSLENAPALRVYLDRLPASGRSRLRSRMRSHLYPEPLIYLVVPLHKQGKVACPDRLTCVFAGIPGPARTAIANSFGLEQFPLTRAEWTCESVEDTKRRASLAADALLDHYSNVASAAVKLTALRGALRALGFPEAIWAETLRPNITRAHNERNEARRCERVAAGIEIPEPYKCIRDLRERVIGYLAADRFYPDGLAAGDLLVTLSARPGEAESLIIGEHGGVRGILKKRGVDAAFNIVSALGGDLARAFLELWRGTKADQRRCALKELTTIAHGWGLQRRDLRAIGAHLAGRAAAEAGEALNQGAIREVKRAALRHAERAQRDALDHYDRVNDV